MDRDKKQYFENSYSFNDLVERMASGDYEFRYKGRSYNITFHGVPCIVVIDEGLDVWRKSLKKYKSEEELLLNHVMDDGIPLLEIFATCPDDFKAR